ncbi:MAG TPA: hypothetical protein VIO57_09665 [Chloroflexota bacterium]
MKTFGRLIAGTIGLLALNGGQATAAAPLQTIALRVNNLRPGYAVANAGYMSEAALASQYHVNFGQLKYYGWTSSYDALYVRRDTTGLGEVGNKLDQYSSAVGAHWGYRVAVQNTLCCGKYHAFTLPLIGQESTGFLASTGTRGFVGVKFREGKYVVGVSILPGTKQASLLLLARLVDQRVRLWG